MKTKAAVNAFLGITTEIVYASLIVVIAFLICLILSLK